MDNTRIEDLARSAARETAAAADAAMTGAEGLANQATEAAGHAYGQVRSAAASVAGSVERQPAIAMLAVGLVFGAVGFLLGRR